MNPRNIFSVTVLNRYLKSLFDENQDLQAIFLKGEVSNFKKHFSGHLYFTLKDSDSKISAVMFVGNALNLTFTPKDGDEVIVYGGVSVYPSQGTYQIYVYEMEMAGLGKKLEEFEKLKKKLQAEGLFSESRKKPIKKYPQTIGLITAPGSAALKDMTYNLARRYPSAEIYFFPSLVQGEHAAKELVKALNSAFTYNLDTIIIGRGGGANEDLSAFNDEILVRAIAASPIPIIAAVGHEIDSTLADFAADRRVSTPTAACEIAVPDCNELSLMLDERQIYLQSLICERVNTLRQRLLNLRTRQFFSIPTALYREQQNGLLLIKSRLEISSGAHLRSARNRLSELQVRFDSALNEKLRELRHQLTNYEGRLSSLNPQAILQRGYCFLQTAEGQLVTSVSEINLGAIVKTSLKDGIITSSVLKKEKTKNGS